MRNYPSAEEARQRSKSICSEKDRQQVDEIFDLIDVATAKGEFLVNYYYRIRPVVEILLKNLNYKIQDLSSQKDGEQYEIEW